MARNFCVCKYMVHTLLSTHLVVLCQIITVTFGDIVKFVYIVDGTLTDSNISWHSQVGYAFYGVNAIFLTSFFIFFFFILVLIDQL